MSNYIIGNTVQFKVTFTDGAGALTDPDTVTLICRHPDGEQVAVANVRQSTGIYTATHETIVTGLHHYRWTTTGPVVIVERTFTVVQSF